MYIVKVVLGAEKTVISGDYFTILPKEVRMERTHTDERQAIVPIPKDAEIYVMDANGKTIDTI